MRAVANEFAKMRHRRVGVIVAALVVAIVGLAVFTAVSSPDFNPDTSNVWNALLAGMSLGFPLVAPLLLAVLASRQTDIEHQSNGWLMQSTTGLTPGGVCRAKAIALGALVTATTVLSSAVVLLLGRVLAGILPTPPIVHWAGFTLSMIIVNLTVLAVQILISAKIDNQLVALGIGVLGTLLAVFSQGLPPLFAHLTPWGYYALAQASGYQGTNLVSLPIAYPSIAGLGVVAVVVFLLVSARFDRQEA